MNRIAKKPITIPEGIKVEAKDGKLHITGKDGGLAVSILPYVKINLKEKEVALESLQEHKQARANLGTMAALTKNAFTGLTQQFSKSLEIEGIGYKAGLEGKTLILSVGFSHPVKFTPPENIKLSVEKNIIRVTGADKALVGRVAAEIRKIKKPEPYQGKGIHYLGEVIRRKAGKKVAGTGTGA